MSLGFNTPSVSIIVPVRNETGTISRIFEKLPLIGGETEIIFIEGGSTDNTWEEIEKNHQIYKETRDIKYFRQVGKGKGDAVRLGFEKASGDILMIYDGDMSVPPEELILFFDVIKNRKNILINGSRFIYKMEKRAMNNLNFTVNKLFSIIFTWITNQKITDTLCGTKAIWKEDYVKIKLERNYFGKFDPFGDFDLLLGAIKQNFDIIEVPVHYKTRVYGKTNIQRWRHGLLLLGMMLYSVIKLKLYNDK